MSKPELETIAPDQVKFSQVTNVAQAFKLAAGKLGMAILDATVGAWVSSRRDNSMFAESTRTTDGRPVRDGAQLDIQNLALGGNSYSQINAENRKQHFKDGIGFAKAGFALLTGIGQSKQ
jgi:hypothetical protein